MLTATGKYIVRSGSNLSEQRVLVQNDGGKTVYYKIRDLQDQEIIQYVKSAMDDTILWTIHTPIHHQQWYLNIQSAQPFKQKLPHLLVSLRSRRVQRDTFLFTLPTLKSNQSESTTPSITTYIIYKQDHVFSSDSFNIVKAADVAGSHTRQTSFSSTTQKRLSALVSSPLPSPTHPLQSSTQSSSSNSSDMTHLSHSSNGPILTFSPSNVLNFSKKGDLHISFDQVAKSGLGVDFWITIALAYIEFLEDKDAYLAAQV